MKARLPQLDALRGLAALSVFWGHAFGMMAVTPGLLEAIKHTPLRFFYDGNAAVLLFFVLSGFVLNLSYAESRKYAPGWVSSFVIRRVLRIYPAFFASVGIALLLRVCFSRSELAQLFSDWFSSFWQMPLRWSQLARCLTLVGPNIDCRPIDPPIWSLVFEMRVSLIFPLVVLLTNRERSPRWDAALLLVGYGVCFPLSRSSGTFLYLPHFLLGAACAKHFKGLQAFLAARGRPARIVFLLAAFVLYETGTMGEELRADWRLNYLVSQAVGE